MQKLMISKKIMDRHNDMERGNHTSSSSMRNSLESFDAPPAKYNIPQEFLQENPTPQQPYLSTPNTKAVGTPSVDAIKKSKLPDEIKRLMIEHPIEQPQQQSVGISDELVEKASRLMKEQSHNYVPDSAKSKTQLVQSPSYNTPSNSDLKRMIKESVEEILRENGVIAESSEKANEIFTFKVGKHIFEGKLTKIKKIS